MTLNFAANALGLDNAATPMGLKAMHALQTLNPRPDTATNAQILFLVLNASSLTLLPVTIFMYRMQQGAPDPTLVFLPILLATSASTLFLRFVQSLSSSSAISRLLRAKAFFAHAVLRFCVSAISFQIGAATLVRLIATLHYLVN